MASTQQLVSQLRSTVDSFQKGVTVQADKMHTAVNKIDSTVRNVDQKIKNLRTMIIQGEEKQLAHENVLQFDQRINEQLKSYITTRKSVMGVIKDFDINLARGSTISELSNELWMTTSRYWLSYAFIAISAWIQDDKELCTNAVKEAVRRDPVKSSLFFCLLNLRFSEHVTAREWLYEYFDAVDSLHPPRETALLIQAYLYGVFGRDPQLDSYMQATMERWMSEIGADHEMATELVQDYGKYVSNLPVRKIKVEDNFLSADCANKGELDATLAAATRFSGVYNRIKQLENAPVVTGKGDFVAKIDKLLDDLVTNYDDEELKLRNEQKFYKLVMDHEGDVEAAKKEYAAFMETVAAAANISKQMLRWAVYPQGEDASVQKFAMQKTKAWLQEAVRNYDREVRTSAPTNFKLSIDLWEDVTDGKDREAVKKTMHDRFMEARSKEVVFTKPNIVLSVLAVLFLIIGCVAGMLITVPLGWLGYVVGGGLFVIFLLIVILPTVGKLKKFPKRIAKAQAELDKCLDEIDGYRQAIEKELAVKDEVLKKLENL